MEELRMDMATCLDAGMVYTQSWGWPCYPISAKKVPLTAHGKNDATLDPVVLRNWFRRWDHAGIAAKTGQGLLVLDVERDGLLWLDSKRKYLPPTLEAKSGRGGRHLYYRCSVGTPSAIRAWPNVDILARGRSVILPPSFGSYHWLTLRRPVNAPSWLLKAASESQVKSKTWSGEVIRHEKDLSRVPPMPKGQRNEQIFKLCCRVLREGKTEQEAQGLLREVNRVKCSPPLRDSELIRIVKNAYRRYSGVDTSVGLR